MLWQQAEDNQRCARSEEDPAVDRSRSIECRVDRREMIARSCRLIRVVNSRRYIGGIVSEELRVVMINRPNNAIGIAIRRRTDH